MKYLRIGITILILVSVVEAPNLYAQSGYSDNLGHFLRFGGGARAMAMAGAYTALSDEGSAVFWNPAGLSQIDRLHLQFMYNNMFIESASYYFISAALPLYNQPTIGAKTTIGFGWAGMNTGDIDRRDSGGNIIGSFSESRNAFLFPVAYDVVNAVGRFSFGARYIYSTHGFADYQTSNSEFDVGFLGHFINPPKWTLIGLLPISKLIPWRVGILFRFPGDEKLRQFREEFPSSMHVGISYSTPYLPIPGRIIFSYEFNKVFADVATNSTSFLGSEYQYGVDKGNLVFALRGGFRPNAGEYEQKLTFGVGARYQINQSFQVSFDYALSRHPVLRDNNTFFLTLQFFSPKNRVEEYEREYQLKYKTLISSYNPQQADSIARSVVIQEFRKKRKEELLRSILKYISDPTIIVDDDKMKKQRISLYKDGEQDTILRSGLAERLSEIHSNTPSSGNGQDNRIVERFDDFAGGLKKLIESYTQLLPEYKKSYLDKKDYQKDWQELAQKFEHRRKKLTKDKEKNRMALHMYLHTLAFIKDSGTFDKEIQELLEKNKGVRVSVKTYYSFLQSTTSATDSIATSAELNAALGKSVDNDIVNYYLSFLKLLRMNPDASALSQVNSLIKNKYAQLFLIDDLPPVPFMPDGLLLDDLKLMKTCLEIVTGGIYESPESAQKQLLSIAYEYPYSTAANILSERLQDIRAATSLASLQGIVRNIMNEYQNWASVR